MNEQERLERNKQTVRESYDQCEPAEAIERYASEVYIKHNP